MARAAKHRLLIVDDDPPIRSLMLRLAARAGFEAEEAKDGHEALERLERTKYEIVIVDLMMPRISGYELLEHINKLQPRPTVIVATAMTDGDVGRLDDSLIRRIIRKPFDIDAVTKALKEIAAQLAAAQLPIADAQLHAKAAAEEPAVAPEIAIEESIPPLDDIKPAS